MEEVKEKKFNTQLSKEKKLELKIKQLQEKHKEIQKEKTRLKRENTQLRKANTMLKRSMLYIDREIDLPTFDDLEWGYDEAFPIY